MVSVLGSLVTPAFVASVITVFFNIRGEKLKAHREYVSSFFQDARNAVSDAVSTAADYFTIAGAERTAGSQTRLFIAEREVRCMLATVCEAAPKLEPPIEVDRIQGLADSFIDLLTGDNFGQAECPASPGHAQQIATVGANL